MTRGGWLSPAREGRHRVVRGGVVMAGKRFRVRIWMFLLVVAVPALLIEGSGMGRRWRGYRREVEESAVTVQSSANLAREFTEKAAEFRLWAAKEDDPARAKGWIDRAEEAEDQAEEWAGLSRYFERRKAHFEDAARRPWSAAGPTPIFMASPSPRAVARKKAQASGR